ncbi:hypothetical protein SDC9_114574 [bioreactor metagenome]|uniref:Uncharacterized protein n=1 Tax=bioreactor metagenome TaxID=1076179 RepID=A0A645BQE0_9ZZZZ
MGHARAADRFDKRLLDDAALDVERELAGALLRRAPAHAVRKAGDVSYLPRFYPFSLFGDGRGAVIGALCHTYHFFNFARTLHVVRLLLKIIYIL